MINNPTYNLRDLIAKAHEEAVKIQSLFEMSTYDLTLFMVNEYQNDLLVTFFIISSYMNEKIHIGLEQHKGE